LYNRKKNNYFVFTSNVDGLFVKAGFDKDKIYERQGSYEYLQCINGDSCSTDTWLAAPALKDIEQNVDPISFEARDSKQLPRCSRCKSLAYHNANANEYWVNERYEKQQKMFNKWLNEQEGKNVVIIEIGAGERLPFIRYPIENIVRSREKTTLVRINPSEPNIPSNLSKQGVGLGLGATEGISLICQELGITKVTENKEKKDVAKTEENKKDDKTENSNTQQDKMEGTTKNEIEKDGKKKEEEKKIK